MIHNESRVHHGNIEDYARVRSTLSLSHTLSFTYLLTRTYQNLSVTGMEFRDVDAKNILEGLHFVFRGARKFNVSAKALHSAIVTSTDINEVSSKVICESWQQEYLDEKEKESKKETKETEETTPSVSSNTHTEALHVGKLRNFDWRLGVSMQSNSCAELKSPFVGLSLEVAAMSGETNRHTLELSISEFTRLHNALREAMRKLELS